MPDQNYTKFNEDGTILMTFNKVTETTLLEPLDTPYDFSSSRTSACDFPQKPYKGHIGGDLEPSRKWFQDL